MPDHGAQAPSNQDKAVKNHRLTAILSTGLLIVSTAALAAAKPESGFYGGVTYRAPGSDPRNMSLGIPATALSRFATTATPLEETHSRALLFGGYRWHNDLAVEAAVNASDPYTLRPARSPLAAGGVGVMPAPTALGLTDIQARSFNVDLYTSWSVFRSFALYGRLGYAQSDVAPTPGSGLLSSGDARRLRDGVNYGVGVRYDLGSALGLRVEYGRFGRFAGEIGSTPLESDQVTFGVQYRF